jgi:leukotriene-A4 hydrolase
LLDSLPRTLTQAQMRALDGEFNFTKSANAEIAHAWFRLAIATKYTTAYPAMEEYMIRIGRRKLIVPLYRDLAATPTGKAQAAKIYAKARDGYHSMARTAVEGILK